MACEGELQIDAAIFADTQWEPAAVYEWLGFLESRATEAGIAIHRVTAGNLRADALANNSRAWMPLYDSNRKQLKRQCTSNYKIRPIRSKVRELNGGSRRPVEQLIGISLDEWRRMRTSDVAYITNVYPLVEKRMTRNDCLVWLGQHGYPKPVRSACVACPFKTNREYHELAPADLSDAIDFDTSIRSVLSRTERMEVFVHRSAVPLSMVDLRSEQERGQTEMFENDGCGVLCPSDDAA